MFLIRRRLRLVLVLSTELGRCCGGFVWTSSWIWI
jgi:hypothetical protein